MSAKRSLPLRSSVFLLIIRDKRLSFKLNQLAQAVLFADRAIAFVSLQQL